MPRANSCSCPCLGRRKTKAENFAIYSTTSCHLNVLNRLKLRTYHFLAAASCRALSIRPLAHAFATRLTITRRPSPRTSTYTSTILRAVCAASAAFSPAVAPYLCATAAETAAPPASMSRTVDASIVARTSAAESATRVPLRSGPVGAGCGDRTTRAPEGEGVRVRADSALRGGRSGLLSGGAGEGPRLRGGSDGGVEAAMPLPLLALELELGLPMARWIKLSTVAAALLLSFAALPLMAWIWVRFFRVVGDCRMRSVREAGFSGSGSPPRL